MEYDSLRETTEDMANTIRDAIRRDNLQVGFLLITVANSGDGHLIFTASNLQQDTALYIASMAEDVMNQNSSDPIGATAGSA